MYLFVVEAKGRFFKKVKEKYDVYIEGYCSFPKRLPYFLYRINEEDSLREIELSEILVAPHDSIKPYLFRYFNGEQEYVETITSESAIILRRIPSYPTYFKGTNISIGNIVISFFFLALRKKEGDLIKRTIWSDDEREVFKQIIASFLIEKVRENQQKAKMN